MTLNLGDTGLSETPIITLYNSYIIIMLLKEI